MTTSTEPTRPFIPGMGVEWLLPLYDPLTRLLGLDRARRALVAAADLRPGHRVLDIGCGTGSLAVLIARLHPGVEVVGLDPDPGALARATRKARRAGVTIQFERGFSDALPFPDGAFDRVFSSFMFHHLQRGEKGQALREVRRVLKAGGSLHLLDFAGPASTGATRRRGLHSHARLEDNGAGTVIALMSGAGLMAATETDHRSMLHGLVDLAYYRAQR
ncbi:MAG TPA: class I SAM-dependent methyltransferase [Vicinamibacterales bacterium]|nr:class I SAM-dependent methyltransferase [Vicinamibacterales bacterium]